MNFTASKYKEGRVISARRISLPVLLNTPYRSNLCCSEGLEFHRKLQRRDTAKSFIHFNTRESRDLNQINTLLNLSEMGTKRLSLLLIVVPICERGIVFTENFRVEAKIEFIMENKFQPQQCRASSLSIIQLSVQFLSATQTWN